MWLKSLKEQIPVIADGGIRFSGDVCKALLLVHHAVMMGAYLLAQKKHQAKLSYIKARSYKSYRGMGSIRCDGAAQGSSDRYFQDASLGSEKLVRRD